LHFNLVLETSNKSTSNPATDLESLRVGYPFSAVVGLHAAKQALLLLAIEPELRGALIASPGCWLEAALAKASGALWRTPAKGSIGSPSDRSDDAHRDRNVVELPLNISEDRLLGGLDLERTITTGKRELSAGLLARAHRQLLYVNDVSLLDASVAAHLADALDSRQVRVEREGMSAIHDADFSLVGVFKSDCEPGSLLRDRVAFVVDSPGDCSVEDKAESINRALRFDRNAQEFADEFALETAELKKDVEEARRRLPRVRASKKQVRQISRIAVELGVEGNRADVFAMKAARANAALAGRNAVQEEDLAAAVQLVLVPRATVFPSPKERPEEQIESSQPESAKDDRSSGDHRSDEKAVPGPLKDIVAQVMDARLPNDLLLPFQETTRRTGNGKRFKARTSNRGRYVRSLMHRNPDARVAIDATLRAAAPHQTTRNAQGDPGTDGGHYRSRRVKIEPGDLRFKDFNHRSGILFILAVDASGSMALNRMSQAKGALTRLLQQAYLHRDMVALISFRGERSDVLLAPTRSVELAKRLIDALPAGGGTPLSAGLVRAIDLARLARLRGVPQSMVVLLTDGRANVGLGGTDPGTTIAEELERLGSQMRSEGISSVVVDTKSKFVSSGESETLAGLLGARYFYLPRSDSAAVYSAISSAARRPREN
jgi:magnesium chelatase subunit D